MTEGRMKYRKKKESGSILCWASIKEQSSACGRRRRKVLVAISPFILVSRLSPALAITVIIIIIRHGVSSATSSQRRHKHIHRRCSSLTQNSSERERESEQESQRYAGGDTGSKIRGSLTLCVPACMCACLFGKETFFPVMLEFTTLDPFVYLCVGVCGFGPCTLSRLSAPRPKPFSSVTSWATMLSSTHAQARAHVDTHTHASTNTQAHTLTHARERHSLNILFLRLHCTVERQII